jgi:predicted nucleic acid-binding protein
MEIIINDANILIDLLKIDLIDSFFKLPYEMHSIDQVLNEVKEKNASKLKGYIEKNSLIVKAFNFDELIIISELSTKYRSLSFPDCSCLYYAKTIQSTLLTGDGKLRKVAQKKLISVKGILWVFDVLVQKNIIPYSIAFDKLSLLKEINQRLPRNEVQSRLDLWAP